MKFDEENKKNIYSYQTIVIFLSRTVFKFTFPSSYSAIHQSQIYQLCLINKKLNFLDNSVST